MNLLLYFEHIMPFKHKYTMIYRIWRREFIEIARFVNDVMIH